ncbi:px domain containing protein [Stylonychia lemnae]|uniref:Px domain containing protein n=1 Tax=Stylonychia lemnae TaxID=5949 RepID=A0A078BAQ2_STYLE|nr:px domain containing protein [Stylonychia lemnae]|eukprot:CDW91301.1 px domain containing protein [Stylonychia lemnae]
MENRRRNLFDDDDEDEQNEYVPSQQPVVQQPVVQQQQNKYEEVDLGASQKYNPTTSNTTTTTSNSRSKKLFDDDEDEQDTYKPSQQNNEEEEQYKTAYESKVEIKQQQQPVQQQEVKKKSMFDDDDEYKPSYEPEEIKQEPVQTKTNPPASQVVAERRNLFDDEPITIEENRSSDYNPYNSDKQKQSTVPEQQQTSTKTIKETPVESKSAPKEETSKVSESERRAKEEAEKVKKQLLEELNSMKLQEVPLEVPMKEEVDPKVKKFTVQNPTKIGGHIKYAVTGVDGEGDFEDVRRFSQFFALKNALQQRWPGIYIPALPEKKLVGNNEVKFVEERRNLLERFMKELAKCDYLIHSKEFKIFAREKGDVEKILNNLVKQTPMQILEKYRLNFNVDEDQESSSLQRYKENIIEFQIFLRKVIPVMEVQKKQLKRMIQTKDASDASYKSIMTNLMRYEDNNIEYYADSDINKRILTNPGVGDMKEKMDDTYKGWKNPFKDAYYWLKGELLDLKGINEALLGRELVVKQQSQCESKKRTDQQELEKLSQGKTTIKSIFKSKSSKESEITNLQTLIEVANKDIADYKKLINWLTIYHGEICIQKFKREKSRGYLKTLNNFCIKEISNSHLSATLWHSLLEVDKQ